MTASIWVLGEALMDCLSQADGTLKPFMGGSPYNMARAAALRGASVGYVNPLSSDRFGQQLGAQLQADGVQVLASPSRLPTSLAVVQITDGQPSYGFYREGIADRDYTVESVLTTLKAATPGVLHTGSLLLVPPEHTKVVEILKGAKALGWTISVDVNLRPKLAADLAAYVAAVREVAVLADWIKASDEDLELLGVTAPSRAKGKEIAALFRAQGASRIALTFGGDGAWLEVDGVAAEADVPLTRVVDTVGAGDTFWGNCLGDWVLNTDGKGRVQQTLKEAMQAAAINCARAGCQPPQYAEVSALV
ncbi:PfkB family carbohydrate kinase [Rhodoferax sp.]|uniref:PfkB family carbohydrate kinase n=1 Tax=Rhodoferax sp. TaxID=50421 RepID=UPI0025F8894E|nr:PfkB family carbohydrate kinase [Rhodoferax sp.]